jgi:hypothetical protein
MEVRQVRFELFTGAEDLHRDSRAYAVLETTRDTLQAPIDSSGVLLPRTRHVVTLPLGTPLPRRDILRIGLRMQPAPSGDVWEVDGLRVVAVSDRGVETLYARGGRRTNQFGTGSETWFEVAGPVEAPTSAGAPPMVDRLRVTIHTGTDDLRGGNDNAEVVVHVRGRTPHVVSFNGRLRLPDLTSRTIEVYLGRAVPLSDLEALEIRTSLSGGGGGDNWNVSRLRIDAIGPSTPRTLLEQEGRPLFRFTGTSRSHRWPRVQCQDNLDRDASSSGAMTPVVRADSRSWRQSTLGAVLTQYSTHSQYSLSARGPSASGRWRSGPSRPARTAASGT